MEGEAGRLVFHHRLYMRNIYIYRCEYPASGSTQLRLEHNPPGTVLDGENRPQWVLIVQVLCRKLPTK